MKVIAVYNVKGGVGKTTTAVNVSYIFSQSGKRVLLIDLDPQANSTDFFLTDEAALSIEDVFDEKCTLADAICHTDYEGLDLVPSTITLSRAEKKMVANTTEPQQLKLSNYLNEIRERYDYVVLDCSPSAEAITNINGLAAADAVFVPLKADKWAIKGLSYTLQIIQTVKKYNFKLRFGGAFYTQFEKRNVNKESLKMIESKIGKENVLQSISKSKNAEETSYTRKPVALCDKRSKMAIDYVQLTTEIENKLA